MLLPRFQYIRPTTLKDGLALLAQPGKKMKILAGGTDLLVNMKHRVVCPDTVVSIKEITELNAVSSEDGGNLRIGSCLNITDLTNNSSIVKKAPALVQAAGSVASQHIRNMATIGGNICLDTRCWYYNQSRLWRDARERCHRTGGSVCHAIKGSDRCHAINSSDIAPVLVALGATIEVINKGVKRLVPAREFYREDGMHHIALEPSEMVAAIHISQEGGNGAAGFVKLSIRKGLDFAMGTVAAWISTDGRRVASARIVAGSIASAPMALEKASQVLMESGLSEKAIDQAGTAARNELGMLTNLFTPAGYKRDIIPVLVKRAIHAAQGQTGKKGRAGS